MSVETLNCAIAHMVGETSKRYIPTVYDSDTLFTGLDSFDLIGQGSFASVRRCYHEDLKAVVVKYFIISGSQQAIKQKIKDAAKEAVTLVNLCHKNIVRVYGITSWNKYCGIIMEEVSDGSLDDLLFSKVVSDISWKIRFKIFRQVVEALQYLHSHKNPFVHGDLKPQNILLHENFTVKLADFGSVAIVQATGMTSSFNIPSNKQYTPFYSAPEILRDINDRKCPSDIYSFAMVGYEIITRHRVFVTAGVSSNLLLYQIKENGQKPNMELVNRVEKDLLINSDDMKTFLKMKHVMMSCWHCDPDSRPNATEILTELQDTTTEVEIEDINKIAQTQYFKKNTESSVKKRMPLTRVTENSSDHAAHDTLLLDYLSVNLGINYTVISNTFGSSIQKITLKNQGDEAISSGNQFCWSIYFNNINHLEPDFFKTKNKFVLAEGNFELLHIDATLYRLTPTPRFKGLNPNESIELTLTSVVVAVSRHLILPRWYVCAPGEEAKVINCTDDEELKFVSDFLFPLQWKQSRFDHSNPFTPGERYRKYAITDFKSSPARVVPKPLLSDLKTHSVEVNKVCATLAKFTISDIIVAYSKSDFFSSDLKKLNTMLGICPLVNPLTIPRSNAIKFKLDSVKNIKESKDAYEIKFDEKLKTVKITAETHSGSFYAVQTLLSLNENENGESNAKLPTGVIKDAPRFDYRGLFIDVATNFVQLQDILILIEVLATYKLNKLVIELANNDGWRIEVNGLPELTEIGSKRSHNDNEDCALYPSFGSGPHENTSGSGFYSISDYKTILKVAAQNHVEIIPCISMPGNCHAAIISMTKRYRYYIKRNELKKATEFLLIDFQDVKTVSNSCGYKLSLIDPSLDSSYRFIEHVFDSLIKMHQAIQPLKLIYIGGCGLFHDVLSEPSAFKNFKVKANIPPKVTTFHEYFMNKVSFICWEKHGVKLGVHANAVLTDQNQNPITNSILPMDALVMFATNPTATNDTLNRAYILANAGYQVVISYGAHLFLDHPQEPDPDERGQILVARYIDDKSVFSFKPDNIHRNSKTNGIGCAIPKIDILKFCKSKVPLFKPNNIVGMQAYIFTKLIRDVKVLHSQLFPRLLAFAERAWHKAKWEDGYTDSFEKDWEEFANVVGYKELNRLRNFGIHYRIPPPGVLFNRKKIKISSLYPGFRYMYRKVDCAKSDWKEIKTDDSLPIDHDIYEIIAIDKIDKRKSRIVKFYNYTCACRTKYPYTYTAKQSI